MKTLYEQYIRAQKNTIEAQNTINHALLKDIENKAYKAYKDNDNLTFNRTLQRIF